MLECLRFTAGADTGDGVKWETNSLCLSSSVGGTRDRNVRCAAGSAGLVATCIHSFQKK